MIDLINEAHKIQSIFENNNWKFAFIGGLALQFLGERRLTDDIDINLLTGFGDEDKFIEILSKDYLPRIPDYKEFALRNRVLLLKTIEGIEIDVSLGALPFEEKLVERAAYLKFAEISLRICSAEDLIISKAFADRTRDWADIESVVQKQLTLDWNYILEQLTPLVELKYAPEILDKLRLTKTKYYQK
jgi:predicted nucleotidyltransferase